MNYQNILPPRTKLGRELCKVFDFWRVPLTADYKEIEERLLELSEASQAPTQQTTEPSSVGQADRTNKQ